MKLTYLLALFSVALATPIPNVDETSKSANNILLLNGQKIELTVPHATSLEFVRATFNPDIDGN